MNTLDTSTYPESRSQDHSADFPIRRWIGRNSVLNVSLIVASIVLAIYVSLFFLLLWPAVIILDDIALALFRFTIFDTDESVQQAYRWQYAYFRGTSGDGRDLGFNLYDGDTTKTFEQAQQDKWDYMLDALGLRPGDRLIDIGCGFGDWINYARSKGIDVTGVNISDEQTYYARDRYGLNVIRSNWKDIPGDAELREQLYGKFDAVTFMDTIEHYAHAADFRQPENVDAIYRKMFEFAHDLLDPDSRVGKVFLSCIHWSEEDPRNPKTPDRKWTPLIHFTTLLMVRTYSGFYPRGADGLVRNAKGLFTEVQRTNRTEDYRYTGVVDKDHFQDPTIVWTLRKILFLPILFALDPHMTHRWLNYSLDAWMRTFGDNYGTLKYDAEGRQRVSHIQLWWILLKAEWPEKAR